MFTIQHYQQISKDDLFDVLALRTKVFVVEQDCPYQELDSNDKKSYHVFNKNKGTVVAVLRLYFDSENQLVKIGRVAVDVDFRKSGLAKKMMIASLNFINDKFKNEVILLSAQTYLIDFYQSLGFNIHGEEFLEDGIPHINMSKGNL
jgi:ElaA protein